MKKDSCEINWKDYPLKERVIGVIVLILWILSFLLSHECVAQNVKRVGTVFVQLDSTAISSKNDKITGYTYKTKDGKTYPIMLSGKGKAYIIKISKTGKQYKQYLPTITKELHKILK